MRRNRFIQKEVGAPGEYHDHQHERDHCPDQLQTQRLFCPFRHAARPSAVLHRKDEQQDDDQRREESGDADKEPIQPVQSLGECGRLHWEQTESLFHGYANLFRRDSAMRMKPAISTTVATASTRKTRMMAMLYLPTVGSYWKQYRRT